MAFGTPGGDQQDQWATIFFLHHVEHNLNLQEAIDFPSFHNEHFPSSFWPRGRSNGKVVLEGRYSEETRKALQSRGHIVTMGGLWSEGRITAAAGLSVGLGLAPVDERQGRILADGTAYTSVVRTYRSIGTVG